MLSTISLQLAVPLLVSDDSIHDAAGRGDLEAVRAFLEAEPELVTLCDDRSRTPLHVAARCGRLEVGRLLLEN